jgi:hypothetical protein
LYQPNRKVGTVLSITGTGSKFGKLQMNAVNSNAQVKTRKYFLWNGEKQR